MTIDEHETSITYDYSINQVRIYTTKQGVASQIKKRSGSQATITEGKQGDRVVSWQITLPMSVCRGAYAITKVLGDEA
ncbi:MAG: hypothetical protein KME13_23795 [Myxacorys californica WJT36-NPBG1]|jgi:hypothetical protein|nr:hypothetical protein [Myxacorys californica WJT36-NPBG1]